MSAAGCDDKRGSGDLLACVSDTIRLEMQCKFDNKTDKNENVWEHVAVKYQAKIDTGELPASDARSLEGLKAKYSLLHGKYRQYLDGLARRKQSGAPQDEIGARPSRDPYPFPPRSPARIRIAPATSLAIPHMHRCLH